MVCGYCNGTALHRRGCPDSRIISERKRIQRRTEYFEGRETSEASKLIPSGSSKTFRLGWKAGQSIPLLRRGMIR